MRVASFEGEDLSRGHLWVFFDSVHNSFSVGLGAVFSNTVFTFADEEPLGRPNLLGVSSFDSHVTVSQVSVRAVKDVAEAVQLKEMYGAYRWDTAWSLARPGVGYVLFEAKSKDQVLVGLSHEPRVETPMYEVSLGPEGAQIRREAQGKSALATKVGSSVDPRAADNDGWGRYWVKVENGDVFVGHGAPEDPVAPPFMLFYRDSQPVPVRYVAITSFHAPLQLRNVRLVDFEPARGPGDAAGNARKGLPIDSKAKGAAILQTQASKDYLEATVLPTLTRGVEELLRLVDKRERDKQDGHDITETFHPLIWLASFLMRNNAAKMPKI